MDPIVLDAVQADGVEAAATASQGLSSASAAASGGSMGGGNGGGLPLSELPEAKRVASVLLRMPFTLSLERGCACSIAGSMRTARSGCQRCSWARRPIRSPSAASTSSPTRIVLKGIVDASALIRSA